MVSLLAVFSERFVDDVFEVVRNFRHNFPQRFWLVFENRTDCIHCTYAVKRLFARNHFVKQNAETENICSQINHLPASLFGRHILRRSHHHSGQCRKIHQSCSFGFSRFGIFFEIKFGKSEIENFDNSIAANHYVVGFNIAVNYSRIVRRGECRCNLRGNLKHLCKR